jgi:hypothetical protein
MHWRSASCTRRNGKHKRAALRLKVGNERARTGSRRSQIKSPTPDNPFVRIMAFTVANKAVAPQNSR